MHHLQAWGNSTVVGPFAEVLATCDHEETIVYATMDYQQVRLAGCVPNVHLGFFVRWWVLGMCEWLVLHAGGLLGMHPGHLVLPFWCCCREPLHLPACLRDRGNLTHTPTTSVQHLRGQAGLQAQPSVTQAPSGAL